MARISGTSGSVAISGTTVLGVTRWSGTESQAVNDVTGLDSGGYAEHLPDGVVYNEYSVAAFRDTSSGGTPPVCNGSLVTFSFVESGGSTYAGSGYISNVEKTNELKQAVTYTFTLNATGAVTVS
jgi:hypothetical protein